MNATGQLSSQPPVARPYHHEKLVELLSRLHPLGKIAEVVLRTIQEVLSPSETIFVCYYDLQLNQVGDEFYSCEIDFITSQNYAKIGFFPKGHTYEIRRIHRIHSVKAEKLFSLGYAQDLEEDNPTAHNFQPVRINTTVYFEDEYGKPAGEWTIETTKPDNIPSLWGQIRRANRMVGLPLSQIRLPEANKPAGA